MIKKILIVDDHFIARFGMALLLENELNDVFVIGVDNFHDALSACATIIFDLVILEINLPDGRKCDLINDVREIQKDVKILIFSAHEENTQTFRYIQTGADGYLNKFNDSQTII